MNNESDIPEVRALIAKLTAKVMDKEVHFTLERDKKELFGGRLYVQCWYTAKCTVTGEKKPWRGRKWYLSDHMTEDEVVKTCYAAFKATVEHEIMGGFLFEGKRVFNPHTPFRVLMEACQTEQYRTQA